MKEIDDTSSFVDTSIFDTTETSMFDDSTRSTRSRPGRPKKVVTIAKDVEAASTINKRTVQEEIQNVNVSFIYLVSLCICCIFQYVQYIVTFIII